MSKLTAYVTGATGCVGNNVVRELLRDSEHSWDVICLHRHASNLSTLPDGVRTQEVALDDIGSVREAIQQGAKAIIHCAGNVSYLPDKNQWRDNVLATRNLAQVAQEKGTERFIFTSTGATLPYTAISDSKKIEASGSAYITTKRLAELEVLQQASRGLYAVIMKPIIVLGPYDWHRNYSRLFAQDLEWALPGKIEFCDARDVAQAHIRAIHHGRHSQSYVLGGTYLTWREMFAKIAEVTGRKPPKKTASKWQLYVLSYLQLAWYRIHGSNRKYMPDLSPELVRLLGGEQDVLYDARRAAEDDLGYHPRGIDETIRDTKAWLDG